VKAWVAANAFSNTVAQSFETPREMRGSAEPDRKCIQHFQALSNPLKMILFFVMAGLVPAIHVFLA
jgi:hypothetical protein